MLIVDRTADRCFFPDNPLSFNLTLEMLIVDRDDITEFIARFA